MRESGNQGNMGECGSTKGNFAKFDFLLLWQ